MVNYSTIFINGEFLWYEKCSSLFILVHMFVINAMHLEAKLYNIETLLCCDNNDEIYI